MCNAIKIDNIEIMTNDKADEVIEELFQSLLFQVSKWIGKINERS